MNEMESLIFSPYLHLATFFFQMSLDDSDQAMSSGSSTESNNNNNSSRNNNSNNNSKKPVNDKIKREPGNKSESISNKSISNKKIESLSNKMSEGDGGEKTETESEMSPASRLVTVDYSLCGKQFGRNSINFHTRQCQRKQQILKGKQEQEQLEERRQASYIIEEDVGT